MKKLTFLFAAMLAFAACSSDDDDHTDNTIKYEYLNVDYKEGKLKYSTKQVINIVSTKHFSYNTGRGEWTYLNYKYNPTNQTRYDTIRFTHPNNVSENYSFAILRQSGNPNIE